MSSTASSLLTPVGSVHSLGPRECTDPASGASRQRAQAAELQQTRDTLFRARRLFFVIPKGGLHDALYAGVRRLFDALHVSCPGGVREAPPGHQMGPPGGLRAPAEATLVVPRHPPDSCCAALACVAADGGAPCAAAPQTRDCRRHTCPQMRRVPVRPRQTGLVADRQPARCLRRRPASRIVVTFRRPTSRASGRVLDDGHAQLTGLGIISFI